MVRQGDTACAGSGDERGEEKEGKFFASRDLGTSAAETASYRDEKVKKKRRKEGSARWERKPTLRNRSISKALLGPEISGKRGNSKTSPQLFSRWRYRGRGLTGEKNSFCQSHSKSAKSDPSTPKRKLKKKSEETCVESRQKRETEKMMAYSDRNEKKRKNHKTGLWGKSGKSPSKLKHLR